MGCDRRTASFLLPPPGGEVVREILSELEIAEADNTRLRASLAAAEELVENLKGALADLSCACQAGGMPDELEQAMRAALLKAEALLRPKQDSEEELSDEAIAALAEAERGEWLSDEEVRGQPVSNCDKLVQPDTEEK